MQTSKILLAIGASLVMSLSVRGADNDAQVKARQALEQQLNQPASQPTATPAPPPAPAPQPAKKIPAAPEMTPAPAPPAAAPETGADDQTIAKARDAMRQKISELAPEAPPSAPVAPAPAPVGATPPPPATPTPEPAPKVVPPPAPETANTLPAGSETGASPEAIAKARVALRQRVAELPNEQPEPGSANEAAIAKAREAMYDKLQRLPPAMASAQAGKGSMEFPPLEGPELPISGAKVQHLHALLQQYKADQITPEQYQAARAKILAEP